MTFAKIGADRLEVELTQQELGEYHLTYGQLNYKNGPTKRVIGDILLQAELECGFVPRGGKLLIEVFPAGKGGCRIVLTRLTGERRVRQRPPTAVWYGFGTLEESLQAARRLPLELLGSSRLYQWEEGFCLQLPTPDSQTVWTLDEYGQRLSPVMGGRAAEHGRFLTDGIGLWQMLSQ